MYFFFFQAEDGIRDYKVTGVQTCALPISGRCPAGCHRSKPGWCGTRRATCPPRGRAPAAAHGPRAAGGCSAESPHAEIGRASCRERGEMREVPERRKKKRGDQGIQKKERG